MKYKGRPFYSFGLGRGKIFSKSVIDVFSLGSGNRTVRFAVSFSFGFGIFMVQ